MSPFRLSLPELDFLNLSIYTQVSSQPMRPGNDVLTRLVNKVIF